MKLKDAYSFGRKVMTNLDSILKSRDIHYFANKCLSSQGYGFSTSHVWMWELNYKESWAQKNWCFWTVVLEKTLESHLDCKEIHPVYSKGNQSWMFTGRTDAEAETPILWLPDAKNWKRPWCWERLKVGGEGDDRGWDGWMASPAQWTWVWVNSGSWWWCCNSWSCKGSNRTERLDWAVLILVLGWWWPHRMSLEVYLPLQFSGRVWVG